MHFSLICAFLFVCFHGNHHVTVHLIHLVSLEIHWGCLCLSEVHVYWFDVTIKLIVGIDRLTASVYCFDLVIRREIGGWLLEILVCSFNVSRFIIWFRVRCLQFLFYCRYSVLMVFVFVFDFCLAVFLFLLYLLKLICKGEHERTCFHTSLKLVARYVLILFQDLSNASHLLFS